MTEISNEFIDIDFPRQPQYTFGDMGRRSLSPSMFATFEDSIEMLPRDQWQAVSEQIQASGGGMEKLVTRIYDQGNEGSCHPPGTLVTMATGEQRPIEDVKCLESVVTAEGNICQVRQTMARPFIGQLVGLHLHGNNLLRCTPEHPILTRRGYLPAKELTADDWVAVPKVRPQVVNAIQTAAYLPYRHRCRNELRIRKFNAPEGRVLTQVQIAALPDMLTLDEKLGRIIGLFLAEGNVDKQKIVWTFSINETETLVAELRQLIEERLGCETKLRIAGSRCTAKVEMYGTLWARLFEGLCSTGSGSKRLTAELASGPPGFLRAVFDGWMAGDGHRGQRTDTGVTISRQLALQMFQIGCRCGMLPAIRRSVPKANKHAATRQPRYDLTLGKNDAEPCWRRDQDETHCWRRVRLLTKEDYKGPVFNLHVHGDESYVADGIGVHNCVGNATAQAIEIIQARQFGEDRVVPLSAISLYKRIGRSPGSGAMLDDSYDEIRSRGILPLDTPENRARFGDHVMPARGFYEPFPPGWESTAKKIVGIEGYVIRSVDGIATALLKQIGPVVVGRQGHSIVYVNWVYKSGRSLCPYPNSWKVTWGQPYGDMPGGFGFDSESQISQSAGYAFCIHSVTFASDFVP